MTSCESIAECALMTADCCGAPCDPTAEDFAAVNERHMAEFRQESCEAVGECGESGCASSTPPRFVATCRERVCVVEDVGALPITACSADADCILRFGLGCCEPCPGEESQLTSVRADALEQLASLTCGTERRCAFCSPEYPEGASAVCVDGRCSVSL